MASQYEVAEFYRQLALLTKSSMPLPETLRNLAEASSSRRFKEELRKLADETAKGRSLSDAMAERPELFPPFFAKMVKLGEGSGALPAVLSELACLARVNFQLATLARDILFYPVVTVLFALLVLIGMSHFVVPQFGIIYEELLEGAALPGLTQLVLRISNLIHGNIAVFSILYAATVVAALWLLSGSSSSNWALLRVSRFLPLSEMVFYNFSMARICSLWSVMMKRGVPDSEALGCIASLSEQPELEFALARAAGACAKGKPLAEAIEAEPDISRLLFLCVANNPEASLPEEMERLSALFKERGYHGFKRVGAVWDILTISGMAIVVGGVALFLFIPLISKILSS